MNNELEKLALEKANLTTVFEKERENLEYLRTQVSEKKTEVSAKTNEIRQYDTKAENERAETHKIEKQIKELDEEQAYLTGQIEHVKANIKADSDACKDLKKQCNKQQTEFKKYQHENEGIIASIKEYDNKISVTEKFIEELNKDQEKNNKKLHDLTEEQ